jgi:large subunit ribosomal protein L22
MKAVLRKTQISPKKANLVAGMVRGKSVKQALDLLRFTPKKGAKILYKVVHSAASNAKNNFNQSLEDLSVSSILVTKGPTYKRSVPISRGRAHPIRKRSSHITVEVSATLKPAKKSEESPKEAKETVKTPKKASVKTSKSTRKSAKPAKQ